MKIEFSKLEEGRGKFSHTYQPAELDLADERAQLSAPAVVDGKVRRSGLETTVSGTIHSRVEVECDRCLKALDIPVNSDFSVEYVSAEDYESDKDSELNEEDLNVSVFDGETIDVDEIVREQILLSVPARALCCDDCKGLCSNCGADLNQGSCDCETVEIDPRWAALKDLKDAE